MTPNPELLTSSEAAALLRIDPATLRRWAVDGKVPSITLPGGNGLKRFRREDIDAILRGDTPERVA